MIRALLVLSPLLLAACSVPAKQEPAAPASRADVDPSMLKKVEAFAAIRNRNERSIALFIEAARVFQHPRCLNCHPRERSPTQGEDMHAHVPMIQATESGHGVPALQCNTCHQSANVETQAHSVRTMPGHPHWALAPASMAWQSSSPREICEQLKDKARNGNRTLEAIHEHVAKDTLVGWAWHPGEGRESAPGTQEGFGELVDAWIKTGAVCPAS